MDTIRQMLDLKSMLAGGVTAAALGMIALKFWRPIVNSCLRWASKAHPGFAGRLCVFVGEFGESIQDVAAAIANDWQIDEVEGAKIEKSTAEAVAAGKALKS